MERPNIFIFEYKEKQILYIDLSQVSDHYGLDKIVDEFQRMIATCVYSKRPVLEIIDCIGMKNTSGIWNELTKSLSRSQGYVDKMGVLVDDNNEVIIKHILETYDRVFGLFRNEQEALEYLIRE